MSATGGADAPLLDRLAGLPAVPVSELIRLLESIPDLSKEPLLAGLLGVDEQGEPAAHPLLGMVIEHLKERFVEEGLTEALERKGRTRPPKITYDGAFDARLTALACSPAPDGRARWTVRLLAEKVVELKIASSVSLMTVQRSLKKTRCVRT